MLISEDIRPDLFSVVYNIDCMKFMENVPDKHFDLAVCDPPYGINAADMNYTRMGERNVRQKNGSKLKVQGANYEPNTWDKEAPPQEYFDELRRVSKNQIIWGINYFNWTGVGPGRLKWDKCVADGVGYNRYEYAYCSSIFDERTITYLWSGFQQGKSLTEGNVSQGNKALNEKRIHPTHKPVKLYEWIYREFCPHHMKILDTHLGGGSNRIAAQRAKLAFIGCEINTDYYLRQEKRWKMYKSQHKLEL